MKTAACYTAIALAILGGIALGCAVAFPARHLFFEQATFLLLGVSMIPAIYSTWEGNFTGLVITMASTSAMCVVMVVALPLKW